MKIVNPAAYVLIAIEDGMTYRQIQMKTKSDNLYRQLKKLENFGLIERKKVGNKYLYYITEKGKEIKKLLKECITYLNSK